MKKNKPKHRGTAINFNGKTYVLPVLNVAAMLRLKEDFAKLIAPAGEPTSERFERVARIVHAALLRNYPQLTIEEVFDFIDFENAHLALLAIFKTDPRLHPKDELAARVQ
jgi:hypothetical protein